MLNFRFSANYANTNNNFVIQNVSNTLCRSNDYFSIVCVLKNILQRGCPTLPSKYLSRHLGNSLLERNNKKIHLIDNEIPIWRNLIKGDDTRNYYPAREFFYEIIPNYLSEYQFIQQLILPEASINDITGIESVEFAESKVDFYLPQAKLVIEIDGIHHKQEFDKIIDGKRDLYLFEYGITTIRIDTKDIREKDNKLYEKIAEIKTNLAIHNKELDEYKKNYSRDIENLNDINIEYSLLATAILRFQITILKLIESGRLRLGDSIWNIRVLERDIKGFAEIAINDLFLWLRNLCKLSKLDFVQPQVNITFCSNVSELLVDSNSVKIDFSLLKRWTNENEEYQDIIFVRNDYYEDKNYFKVSISDPIKYQIIVDGDDSDYLSLVFILENIFGFTEFNPGQLPIIINALSCTDTVGLLPTGSGKSLCYQFVALLQPCVSFIVVPIKALMYDQKYNLDKRYITHTNYISSDQTGEDKDIIQKNYSEGRYLFVWISPERFQTRAFRDYLDVLNKNYAIGMAVIDEVHCLSEWGHDFRTSYLNLSKTIRKYCPSATFLGLTATASVNVLKDILIEFEINRSNVKTLPSFTRPELTFKVLKDNGKAEKDKNIQFINLMNILVKNRDVLASDGEDTRSGIIFTPFVNGNNGCYKLSNELNRIFNTQVHWYSGKVPEIKEIPVMDGDTFNNYKRKVQTSFQNNEFPLLVATKAFGMGIDKSNIRYTIHYGMPSSIESLYQEAGRAGRDKKPAACYVLYSSEYKSKDYIDKVFDLNSTVDDIREIQNKFKFDGRDILRNIFLWLSNRGSIKEDFKDLKIIIDDFAEPNAIKIFKCKELKMSLGNLQKSIYKLSLLRIVEDWIIKDWNKKNGIIEVSFLNYTDDSVMRALIKYIQKYDKNFVLTDKNKQMEIYHKILEEDLEVYEKACKILLNWQYENIAYNRRQSIKNLADLCENFNDSKQFQKTIEDYFRFSDGTYYFDYIAENPKEYRNWFSVFSSEENELLPISEIRSLKDNLSRFLESYRYNTGLNFLSGIIRLVLKEYQDQDGKARLQSALEQISSFNQEDKNLIFESTLEIGKAYLDEEGKQILSEVLLENSSVAAETVYKGLGDYYSLNYILKNSINRINKVGDGLL